MDGTKILTHELWELMIADGGEAVDTLRKLKKREDRRGRVKRILCRAVDESSLGCFNGMAYHYTGKVYSSISIRGMKKVLYDILALRVELPDGDLSRLSDIYEDCLNVVFSKPLQVSNSIMIFNNGVLDVEANKFHRSFNKRFVQMWSVDYDYTPSARTFKWYQFLNQVLPDKHFQDILQMFLGATFLDRHKVKIEHILILLGKGANGKSVIQGAIRGVLGDEYVAKQEIGRLCARGADGDEAVALINGKRLNYCTEMEVTDFYKKSARMKAIVSGESVPARFRYGIGFEATNIPLLMANANQLPIFNRKDDAMIRRIYVIPFEVSIPPERQNKMLGDELTEEYPAILNWILEGRDMFIANGYHLPTDTALSKFITTEEHKFSSALKYMSVNGWLSRIEGVDISPVNWKRLTDLYSGYSRWCGMNELNPVGKSTFCYILENQGGFQKKRMANGVCFAVFGDITVRTLEREQSRMRRMLKKAPETTLMWVEGVAWATSLKALAAYADVSDVTVRRLNREGKFAEHVKAHREKAIYDVEACCKVMRDLRVIATDAEKDIVSRLRKELKYLRWNFNQWCLYNNFPYRKYGREEAQIDPNIIVVPDETTNAEVIAMARGAGLDVSKATRFKSFPGAFGRGGKGFFENIDMMPTDEERKMIENLNSEDYEKRDEE